MFGVLKLGKLGASMKKAGFNPRTLFAASEPGAWYDPSDMSTLFQDSAGTVPVTAVEQPVGLILDKSGRGNHATQATTTKRPVLSRRVNLFTESEFRNGVTDAAPRGGLISASTLPGYSGAVAFAHNGSTDSYAYKAVTGFDNTPVTLTLVVRMDDGSAPRVGLDPGPSNDFRVAFNGVVVVPSQQEIAPGVYRLTASATATSGGAPNFGVIKYGIDSIKTFKVTAYDLRLATDAHLSYQRVNTATDYDADPAKYPAYLRFDGVDDALQTGNIDFTSTDKMTVWAGVTPGSVAANAMLLELSDISNANDGAFKLLVPETYGDPTVSSSSRGTSANASDQGVFSTTISTASPLVISTAHDISGDRTTLSVNGVAYSPAIGDKGAGDFGNYPLYIGARAGTSLFFNGRLGCLIIRGAYSTESQIEATELYMKKKVGIA